MKERITYIRDNKDEFHPDQLEVEKNAMHIKSLKAAKEHRLTFDYDELPAEVGVLDMLSGDLSLIFLVARGCPQSEPGATYPLVCRDAV